MMIPGEVRIPRRKHAYITYLLIAVNTVIYMTTSYKSYFITADTRIIWDYGFIPGYLSSLDGWIRILTSMFLHANILHIFFNMYFLFIFGRDVENFLGPFRYLLLYMISGFVASMTHTSMIPVEGMENLGIPAIGASGAISGVLGAFLLLYPGARLVLCIPIIVFPLCGVTSSSFFIIFWFILQIVSAYLQAGSVAFFAHVGGFLAGMMMLYLLGRDLAEKNLTLLPERIDFDYVRFSVDKGYGLIRRGLGRFSRSIMIIMIIVVISGLLYSAYDSTKDYAVYAISVKASLTVSGGTYESEAIVIIVRKNASPSYVIAPIADDIIRVLFNRLYSAGYIVNNSLADFNGSIQLQNQRVVIEGLKAPPVFLDLYMPLASYDSSGVIVYGYGNATTELLSCTAGGVCTIGGVWKYNYFDLRRIGVEGVRELFTIPIFISLIVSLTVLIILLKRYDLKISLM
ncbi:MAG: rhomboid family intramembrane serine protease, partial [Sulfolobales archaeon]